MKIEGVKLPTLLSRQPIIDAVAEIRFLTPVDASLILPGFILRRFPQATVEKLPASEMPDFIRQSDENLKHQPLIRIMCEEYFFLIGSGSIGVGCKLPYPGWEKLKEVIKHCVEVVSEAQIVSLVTRYSLKYADLIECDDAKTAIGYLDLDVQIAGESVGENGVNVHITMPGTEMVHLLQIAMIASVQLMDGRQKKGVLISVDSISGSPPLSMTVFKKDWKLFFEAMHAENKARFFSCLKEETLVHLGAQYV